MVKPTASVELSGLAESGVLTTDRFGARTDSLAELLAGEALVGVAVAVLFSVPLKPEAVGSEARRAGEGAAAMSPMVSVNVLALRGGIPAVPEASVAVVTADAVVPG